MRTWSTTLIVGALGICGPAAAEMALRTDLVRGVVVDAGRGRAYLMGEDGVVAVDVASGRALWTSAAALQPVAAVDERVVAIGGEAAHAGLVLLDADTGAVAASCEARPPAGVYLGVMDGLGVNVGTRGYLEDGEVVLRWSRSTHYAGGVYPSDEMLAAARSRAAGRVAVDPATGCLAAREEPPPDAAPTLTLHGDARRQGPWTVDGVDTWLELVDHDDGRAVVLHRERAGEPLAPPQELARAPTGYAYASLGPDRRTAVLATQRRTDDGLFRYDLRHVTLATGAVRDFPGHAWVPQGHALVDDVLVVAGGAAAALHPQRGMLWSVPLRRTSYDGPYPP